MTKPSKPSNILSGDKLEQEYQAKIAATALNLRRYYNESLGIIDEATSEKITREQAFQKLEDTEMIWAKLIVDDISPKRNIL